MGHLGDSNKLTFVGKIGSLTVLNTLDTIFASTVHNNRIREVYPPGPLTNNTTTLSGYAYGNGTYVASMSSFYGGGYEPYRAFDFNTGTWNATSQVYSTTGAYTGTVTTTISGIVYSGEWIQMQFPAAFMLKGYVIWPESQYNASRPMSWVVAGSSNGTVWTLLDSSTSNGASNSPDRRAIPAVSTLCTHFRMVMMTNNKQTSNWAGFKQLSLF